MFGRRAWYKTPPASELPWLVPEDILENNAEQGTIINY
jgi:hypothetical protein